VLAAALVVALKTALKVWTPMEGMILRIAFPPTNCAFPKIAVTSHKAAAALQKVIDPVVTGAPLAVMVTEAVKVTGVCHATVDEESVSVVVVNGAACAAVAKLQATVSRADGNSLWMTRRDDANGLQAEKDTFHIQTVLGSHFTEPVNTHRAKAASGPV
jgi:hypothetical protein